MLRQTKGTHEIGKSVPCPRNDLELVVKANLWAFYLSKDLWFIVSWVDRVEKQYLLDDVGEHFYDLRLVWRCVHCNHQLPNTERCGNNANQETLKHLVNCEIVKLIEVLQRCAQVSKY